MSKEQYLENTGWVVEERTFYIDSDGSRVDKYLVTTRMYEGVQIVILPSGETYFTVSYPFNDITPEERFEMIEKAKCSLPNLIVAS